MRTWGYATLFHLLTLGPDFNLVDPKLGHDLDPITGDNLGAHVSTCMPQDWFDQIRMIFLSWTIFFKVQIFGGWIFFGLDFAGQFKKKHGVCVFVVVLLLFHDQPTNQCTKTQVFPKGLDVTFLQMIKMLIYFYSPASGSSPPKLSRVGANSKAAAHDEDEEEKENAQCKPGLEGGDTFQEHHSSVISHSEEKRIQRAAQ